MDTLTLLEISGSSLKRLALRHGVQWRSASTLSFNEFTDQSFVLSDLLHPVIDKAYRTFLQTRNLSSDQGIFFTFATDKKIYPRAHVGIILDSPFGSTGLESEALLDFLDLLLADLPEFSRSSVVKIPNYFI